jgi:hypothetical protein
MSDEFTLRKEVPPPPPEGQFQAVCVDVINLGESVVRYQNQTPYLAPKMALVFQIAEDNPDTGKPWEISREFTASLGKKANCRTFLGGWRGKSYSDEDAAKGIPVHKLTGVNGLITIEHKTSSSGNVYAFINNATPLPKQMAPMQAKGYTRSEFWAKKKEEYKEEADTFRASQKGNGGLAGAVAGDPDWQAVAAEKDDLPF